MSEFTWDTSECDSDIYKNGKSVLMSGDSNESANKFIRSISNITNCKLDFFNAAGRCIIKTLPENFQTVVDYIATLSESDMNEFGITQYIKYN